MSDVPQSTLPAEQVTGAKGPADAAKGALGSLVLSLLLLDLAVETFLAGSPILWVVMGIEALALVLLALLWSKLGATSRVAIPLLAVLAAIAWGSLRLGSWADPAVRMATLGLPRLVTGLSALAIVFSAVLLFSVAVVRRAWYLGAAVGILALYALVPVVRGLVAGAPLLQVLTGTFDWQRLPAWLQGGFVGTEVVLPLGLVAGLAALAASFSRHTRATLTTAGLLVVAAAFVVQSAELTRAGRSHLAGVAAAPALARLSAVAAPDAGTLAQLSSAPPGTPVALPGAPPAEGQAASEAEPAGPVTPVAPGAVLVAPPGQSMRNKAIELSVTNLRTASSLGDASAGAGREFVVVDMAWKNILPKQKVNRKKASDRTAGAGSLGFGGGTTARDEAEDEANTTLESVKFQVSPLPNHLWLVADGRFGEAIDAEATSGLEGHLGPDEIGIPNSEQVVSGSIAFKAPAGAQAFSILFLDTNHGHILLPVKGAPPVLASSLGSGSRANQFVDLALTNTSWAQTPGEVDARSFVVGLRGISRQPALVDVKFDEFGFLQTDQGCLVEPDEHASGLARSLAPVGRFLPFVPSEGQLAFRVAPGAKPIAFLLRLQQGGPIDMPLAGDAKPSWPAAESTITDGDVLKVMKLPGTAVPAGVPAASGGGERVAIDLVVQNLRSGSGIDLQADQQFRLVTPDGKRHEPSDDSARAPCSLGGAVVPAGVSRRFTLVYDVPPGQPLQFEYRGFNVKSQLVKVR
jgi:hypothetical protein